MSDSVSTRRSQLLRWMLGVSAMLLLAGLVALLAWGIVRSGGRPGGLIVNSKPGEVKVPQRPAPEFTLPLFDAGTLSLSNLQGKVVMVDFWASWCPPCREEAPGLAQVYSEYKGTGVEFVGIDIWDTEQDAKRFISRYGIAYPNGLDAKGRIAIDYGVTGIPEKYFIDRSGVLVKKYVGPMTATQLRQILEGLLGPGQ